MTQHRKTYWMKVINYFLQHQHQKDSFTRNIHTQQCHIAVESNIKQVFHSRFFHRIKVWFSIVFVIMLQHVLSMRTHVAASFRWHALSLNFLMDYLTFFISLLLIIARVSKRHFRNNAHANFKFDCCSLNLLWLLLQFYVSRMQSINQFALKDAMMSANGSGYDHAKEKDWFLRSIFKHRLVLQLVIICLKLGKKIGELCQISTIQIKWMESKTSLFQHVLV